MIVIGITDNHLRQRLREPDLTLDYALKLGHAYEETKKHPLELRRDFLQSPEIDQIDKFRKYYRSQERNPNLEVIVNCKFCSGTYNKGSCPAYGKICNNCGNKGHFAKCCTKKKSIHSLNQECSDNTAQNDSPKDWKFFIGTINVQNSNPSDSGNINLENTNNRNFSTKRLSDNSSYQIFDDNSKVTDKRNILFQNKSDNDNWQRTQNVNNVQCLNISRGIYMDVIDKKSNSEGNVSRQTNDCIITYKVDPGTQANVILKQTLACIPKSVVIEPTNVKSSAYNGYVYP